MGSTHTRTSAGCVTRRLALAGIAVAGLGLSACAGDDDDDAATSATIAPAATEAAVAGGDSTGFGVAEAPEGAADEQAGSGAATLQVPAEQQIAIEARASVQTDDVKAAVDRVTTTVAARGGRIAAADIDYARPADAGAAPEPVEPEGSRATLVVAIPPAELGAVRDVLEDVGDVLSYDQLAEDVTEQLTDLDTRITNQRASIERIRELYANAPDVDSIVRIEAELTNRETVLEQLLATQQNLTGRVALSTLTIDIAATPGALEPVVEDDDPGLGDALAAGWSAFAGGVFAIVLALSAALPFILTAIAVLVVVLWVRSRMARRSPSISRRESEPLPDHVSSASRPE